MKTQSVSILRGIFFVFVFFGFIGFSRGQVTVSWRTEAANGNWENGSNTCAEIGNVNSQWWYNGWGNNSARNKPDCFGSHILVFDNNHQLTMSLGTSSFNVHRLVFSSGNSSARTIGTVGNGTINFFEFTTIWPRIQNNSSAVHTINAAIIGSPNAGFNLELVPSTQSLIFGGTINNNGKSIQVYGNNSAVDANNRFVQLNGIVSGSGPLNISQFGVVKLNASNSYTGQTQIDNGELWMENTGSISSSSAIFVGNGGQVGNIAKLWISSPSGGSTFSNNITVNNGNANTRFIGGLNTAGTHIFTGIITNNSDGGLCLAAEGLGGTVAFDGVLTGSKPILTSGAGTVFIGGSVSNTYTTGSTTFGAATTVLNKSANAIAIMTNATLSAGKTLRTDAPNQWGTGTPPLLTISGNGVFNLNSNNQKVALASISSNAVVSLGSAILNIDNTASDSFAGAISGTGGVLKTNTGTQVFTGTNTYTGTTTINGGTIQLNKTGGGTLPSTNSITVNSGGTLKISSNQTLADLTINTGGAVIVDPNVQLTINGALNNSGTFTMENGATLLHNGTLTSGAGAVYNVKQDITGAGSSTPTGRFWYVGSPVSQASSAVFFASSLANVAKKRDEAANAWVSLNSGSAENLEVGRGYYIQAVPSSSTLNFTGGAINNGTITTPNLTSAGTSFTGFNLVSNPYPSYIDWTAVTKTNVGTTMWYRTHDGSGMNFGTVNASGVGTTIGTTILTKYIPPMQSFWVRVATYGQSASLTFNNTDRSHFISENNSVAGLKSSNDSPTVFIRMNLKQAEKMDQLVVYTEDQATNGLDYLDAEKMMQATHPQFYTKVGSQKTVINALNAAKKQQALPITMELPTTGIHTFIIEDLEISNGLVWLEDKQEEIVQALEPGTVYEFYAASGMNAERFVLHFQLIDDAVPTNVYNEVNSSANFSGKGASVYAESAGVVVIKLPASTEGVTDIQIRDAAGKLVYAGSMNNLETSVELAQANGIYYVTLSSNTGVEVRKVFIQQ